MRDRLVASLPLPMHKMLLQSYEEDFTKFVSGGINYNNFLLIFAGMASKLEKVGPTFSSFNPCQSLPSVAKDERKHFQCLNISLNYKTGQLFFQFNGCAKIGSSY